MKKIFLPLIFALFTINSAKAEFYLGVDLLQTFTHLSAKHDPNSTADFQVSEDVSEDKYVPGAAINLGYKFHIGNFFIAPELSLQYIGKNSFAVNDINKIEIQQAAGAAKMNFGYSVNRDFDVFVLVGTMEPDVELTNTSLVAAALGANSSTNLKASYSPVFGGGLIYNLNQDWSVKFGYEYLKIKIKGTTITDNSLSYPITFEVPKTNINMHTARIGIIYNF